MFGCLTGWSPALGAWRGMPSASSSSVDLREEIGQGDSLHFSGSVSSSEGRQTTVTFSCARRGERQEDGLGMASPNRVNLRTSQVFADGEPQSGGYPLEDHLRQKLWGLSAPVVCSRWLGGVQADVGLGLPLGCSLRFCSRRLSATCTPHGRLSLEGSSGRSTSSAATAGLFRWFRSEPGPSKSIAGPEI